MTQTDFFLLMAMMYRAHDTSKGFRVFLGFCWFVAWAVSLYSGRAA